MEGHLTYVINGIERKMFFGNYALEKVLKHFNVSLNDLDKIPDSDQLEFIRIYMYHAMIYVILKDGGTPDFREIDTHEWVEESNYDLITKVTEVINESLRRRNITESDTQKKSNKKA